MGSATGAGFVIVMILFELVVFALAIAAMVFWILALVDALKYTDYQYAVARQSKVTQILLIALLGAIGAAIYWFSARPALRTVAAQGIVGPPPGMVPWGSPAAPGSGPLPPPGAGQQQPPPGHPGQPHR